ncbi:unnamed protein product [Gadus morhua 'NCC']
MNESAPPGPVGARCGVKPLELAQSTTLWNASSRSVSRVAAGGRRFISGLSHRAEVGVASRSLGDRRLSHPHLLQAAEVDP